MPLWPEVLLGIVTHSDRHPLPARTMLASGSFRLAFPSALLLLALSWPSGAAADDRRCLQSCCDSAYFVAARTAAGGVGCLGPAEGTCSWFTDANCSTTLSGTPPGSPLRPAVACPAIPTPEASDWCAEAIRVVVGGREPTVCDGLGSCPELPTGGWNYGAADFQCINFPSATSPMWTPVKLVPGAAPGSLVPACMSADSSACIKTSLAGCEHLALRGSAIGTVPYVACTEEYAVAVKMRRDGKSWCRRARSTLRFHMYLDPALAGMAGVKAQ